MYGNLNLAKMFYQLGLIFGIFITFNIAYQDGHFKVPLEVREKSRPVRKVDTDSELQNLKKLQDQFFNIIQRSSLGKEFKSFNQVFELISSDEGKELGKLILNGVQIGAWREDSSELLSEFLDDFQYKVSPDFGDALLNYIAFIKTIDLKTLPAATEILFRKDNLGNSLASMPLGQLIDMVQEETSKYGVDIRKVINAILGKNDSSFPKLIEDLLSHWSKFSLSQNSSSFGEQRNISGSYSFLKLFKPSVAHLLKENEIDLDADAVIQVVSYFLTQAMQGLSQLAPSFLNKEGSFDFSKLMPILGFFLRQTKGREGKTTEGNNNQMLDTVMRLMSNIGNKDKASNGSMDILSTVMSSLSGFSKNKKNNKGEDIISTLTGLLGSDNSSKDTNKMLDAAMNLMAGLSNEKDKKHDKNAEILKAALNMVERLGKKEESNKEKEAPDDKEDLLITAMKLLNTLNGKDGNTGGTNEMFKAIQGLTNMMGNKGSSDGSTFENLGNLLNLAGNLLNKDEMPDSGRAENTHTKLDQREKLGKENPRTTQGDTDDGKSKKSSGRNKDDDEAFVEDTGIPEEKTHTLNTGEKTAENIPDIPFRKQISSLLQMLRENTVMQNKARYYVKELRKGLSMAQEQIKLYLNSIAHTMNSDFNHFLSLLSYAEDNFQEFKENLKDGYSRKTIIEKAIEPATKIVSLLVSDEFQKQYREQTYNEIKDTLKNFGLQDLTLENFVDRITPLLSVYTMSMNIPVDARETLLEAQSLAYLAIQKWSTISHELRFISKRVLRIMVEESLENDFAVPLLDLIETDEMTKEDKSCLPSVICNFRSNSGPQRVIKSTIYSGGSIIYAMQRLKAKDDFRLLLDVVEAVLLPENCEVRFAEKCPQLLERPSTESQEQIHSEL